MTIETIETIEAKQQRPSHYETQSGGCGETAPSLSAREREILQLVADGYTQRSISVRLGRGLSTVKAHMRRIRRKLGCASTAQAVAMAVQRGMVQSGEIDVMPEEK